MALLTDEGWLMCSEDRVQLLKLKCYCSNDGLTDCMTAYAELYW